MLNFLPLDKNVNIIKDFITGLSTPFCDLSLGTKFMWRDDFICSYAIFDDTLILKESCPDYKDAYYFPLGKNPLGALEQIEKLEGGKPFKFCCLDNASCAFLAERYFKVDIFCDRDWSDYFYSATDFITFKGKKFSGQRNHINKFKRLYPNFEVKNLLDVSLDKVKAFLGEFERGEDYSMWSEIAEQKKVLSLIENLSSLNNLGACILVDDKLVALSVGEIVGDTLIVHVEKGLKNYSGVYPTMAQEFAKLFASDSVKFINREEDCGDMGLRISKLQYHPVDIKDKNILTVKRAFEKICPPILIKGDRVEVGEITASDSENYYNLCIDDSLNEFWGYDYKEDLKGELTKDYFYNFAKSLIEKKEEYPLAIRVNERLVGEVTMHNFDYFGGVEIGFRLFRKEQNKGYALEATSLVCQYIKDILGGKKIKAKCYKQNEKSKNLLVKLGLKKTFKDEKMLYFEKKL